ncbi:hypothetical protein PT974_09538 [Cladobotryum mycophilum]|uniref:Uncharacterized protein n=1 Tax=Cladobotryum mycophilum TaxID=491253 RepID=A0ABR0SGF1_9HYPO
MWNGTTGGIGPNETCNYTAAFKLGNPNNDVEGLGVLINSFGTAGIALLVLISANFTVKNNRQNPVDAKVQEIIDPIRRGLTKRLDKLRGWVLSLIKNETSPVPNSSSATGGRAYYIGIKSLRLIGPIQTVFAYSMLIAFLTAKENLNTSQLKIMVYVTLANYITNVASIVSLSKLESVDRAEYLFRYFGLAGLTGLQITGIIKAIEDSLTVKPTLSLICSVYYDTYALSTNEGVFWIVLISFLFLFLALKNMRIVVAAGNKIYKFVSNQTRERRRSLLQQSRSVKWYRRVFGLLFLQPLNLAQMFFSIISSNSIVILLITKAFLWLTIQTALLRSNRADWGIGQATPTVGVVLIALQLIGVVVFCFLTDPPATSQPDTNIPNETQLTQQTAITSPPEANEATDVLAEQQNAIASSPETLEAGGLPVEHLRIHNQDRTPSYKPRWCLGLVFVVAAESITSIAALSLDSSRQTGNSGVWFHPNVYNASNMGAHQLFILIAYLLLSDALEYLYRGTFWDRLSQTCVHYLDVSIRVALCIAVLTPNVLSIMMSMSGWGPSIDQYAFGALFALCPILWAVGGILNYLECIKEEETGLAECEGIQMLELVRMIGRVEEQMSENSGGGQDSSQMQLQLNLGDGGFAQECELILRGIHRD